MTYWYGKKFEKWEDAVAFQKEKVLLCFEKGWPIRECNIVDELDFDTKIRWYCSYVRPFYTGEEDQGDKKEAWRSDEDYMGEKAKAALGLGLAMTRGK